MGQREILTVHAISVLSCTTTPCTSQRSSKLTHPLIMIGASRIPWKHTYTASPPPARKRRFFATVSLFTTGSAFTQVEFQIDTAATCNTLSLNALRSLLPDAKLKRSPYRLYPYGNSKLLEPEGLVDLVTERKNNHETLTFQVLPDSSMGCKSALLSGSDSERLELIKVHADEIQFLSFSCRTRKSPRVPVFPSMGCCTVACRINSRTKDDYNLQPS